MSNTLYQTTWLKPRKQVCAGREMPLCPSCELAASEGERNPEYCKLSTMYTMEPDSAMMLMHKTHALVLPLTVPSCSLTVPSSFAQTLK
jgi:hypothetical protein